MAQDQVEEVKQKTDIVSVISEHLDLKKAGRNYKALCPFHGEKTPSFMVSPELQIFKCFGCGESGDAISFLQKHEGMDFPEALKFLADKAGVKLKQVRFEDKGIKQRIYELNSFALSFYHYILLKHSAGKEALNYLRKQRGLKLETIKIFKLGFSPEARGVITKFLLEKKGFSKIDLEKSGIVYLRNGHHFDRFRGRVIFPLNDHRGNVAGFAGRILPSSENKDLAKYINTPDTPVYHKTKLLYGLHLNKANIKKSKEAVVVEGELDAILPWQIGIKNIVAIKGSAFTEDQGRLLSRYAERAVFALDEDVAGDEAARRGVMVAEKAGLEVQVASLGKYKDPDEMARRSPKGLKKAIKDSLGVWDFIIKSTFSRHKIDTGTGKARLSKEVIPILSSIEDEIVRAHYIEIVAKKLQVPSDSVASQISKAKVPDKKEDLTVLVVPKGKKDRRQLLEERFMSLAFSIDQSILFERKTSSLIQTPLAKRILKKFKACSKKKSEFNPSEFAEDLPKELVSGFADMIFSTSFSTKVSLSSQKKELKLIKHELAVLNLKKRMAKLTEEMKIFEKNKQKKRLKTVEEKFSKITHELTNLKEVDTSGIIL